MGDMTKSTKKELQSDFIAKSVTTMKIDDLIPYVNNARTHSDSQVDQIAASINEFGFTNPILIDEHNTIIAGHGRVMAAKKLGMESVPVIMAKGWTKAQVKAYTLADNKLALNAGWDNELLAIEFAELQELDFDLDLTGFSLDEVGALVDKLVQEGLTDEDAVPDVTETPVTVLGDVWILGNHRLMCGDSTSIDAVEKLMDGKQADMVVTDPPYNVDYEGRTKDALTIENDKMGNADFYQFLLDTFTTAYSVLKDGASIYVFHADMEGVNFRTSFVDAGFKLSQICIWAKQTMVMGRNDYHWKHEPVLYGWKPTAAHNWESDRKQTTLWNFDRPFRNDVHPTMKPIDLIEYPINNSSKAGQVVLDLFGGSGSTLIACEKTGRNARLMELDPKYCDVIVKRWQEFTGNKAVHAETGEAFNAK